MKFINPYENNSTFEIPDNRTDDIKKAISVGYEPVKIGYGETIRRAGGQGLTSGFSDELTGLVKGSTPEELAADRALNAQAYEDHPILATVADIGGSLLPTAATVAGTIATGGAAAPATGGVVAGTAARIGARQALKIAAKEIGKQALLGAAQGGIAGIGYGNTINNPDTDIGDTAESALSGAAVGGALGGGLAVGSKIASKLSSGGAKKVAKSMANVLVDVPEEATERYVARPQQVEDAIKAGTTIEKIGSRLNDDLAQVTEDTHALSGDAVRVLENSGKTVPVNEVMSILDKKVKSISKGLKTQEDIDAIKSIQNKWNNLYEYFEKNGDQLPLTELKRQIQELDVELQPLYDERTHTVVKQANKQVQGVRQEIDALLKKEAPSEYKEIMKKISGDLTAVKDFRHKISSESGTTKTLKDIAKTGGKKTGDKQLEQMRAIDAFLTTDSGDPYIEKVKDAFAAAQFTKDATRGSKGVNLGGLTGMAIGAASGFFGVPPVVGLSVGAGIGAIVGGLRDKYGGQALRKALQIVAESPAGVSTEKKVLLSPKVSSAITDVFDAIKRAKSKTPNLDTRSAIINATQYLDNIENPHPEIPQEQPITTEQTQDIVPKQEEQNIQQENQRNIQQVAPPVQIPVVPETPIDIQEIYGGYSAYHIMMSQSLYAMSQPQQNNSTVNFQGQQPKREGWGKTA